MEKDRIGSHHCCLFQMDEAPTCQKSVMTLHQSLSSTGQLLELLQLCWLSYPGAFLLSCRGRKGEENINGVVLETLNKCEIIARRRRGIVSKMKTEEEKQTVQMEKFSINQKYFC